MAELYNFFGDIWDYLRETYYEAEVGGMRNIHLPTLGVSLFWLVFAIGAGVILAAAVTLYQKNYLGGLVRALLARGAQSEETALTLGEVGIRPGFGIRQSLRARGSALRRVVRLAGYDEENAADAGTRVSRNGKPARMTDEIDYTTARFYIPAALRTHAQVRYDAKGSGPRAFLLTVAVVLVASLVLLRFVPAVFHLADDLLTAVNSW